MVGDAYQSEYSFFVRSSYAWVPKRGALFCLWMTECRRVVVLVGCLIGITSTCLKIGYNRYYS